MQKKKSYTVFIGFMLFSMFFGAGNLIFPPFLGKSAGSSMPIALIGFFLTGVALPILGVFVVSKIGGLEKLASKVHPYFATFFIVVIYLSIGPGLAIPRAASVPYEMAVAPYLPEGWNEKLLMLIYSFVFFALAVWIALSPGKLLDNLGKYLTPVLIGLLVLLFFGGAFFGSFSVAKPQGDYAQGAFFVGIVEGYQTMDAMASLVFGLVVGNAVASASIPTKKEEARTTLYSGLLAGGLLLAIYAMLAYMGMANSETYASAKNGAEILSGIAYAVFGDFGIVLLIILYTVACLTTCVGLINSTAEYFSGLIKKVPYKVMAILIALLSMGICNFGLNTILTFSVPLLNAVYPLAIVLILLGAFDRFWKGNKIVYPLTVSLTGVVNIVYVLGQIGVPLGVFGKVFSYLPLSSYGLGWVLAAVLGVVISVAIQAFRPKKEADTQEEI